MAYNETITIINYAKDLDIEYNIKLFLLLLTFIYSVGAWWLAYKWETDRYYGIIIKNYLLKIPFGVILFFYPLLSIMLFRTLSWEVFYGFMIAFYTYAIIVLFISAKLGIFEFAADMFGIRSKTKKIDINT